MNIAKIVGDRTLSGFRVASTLLPFAALAVAKSPNASGRVLDELLDGVPSSLSDRLGLLKAIADHVGVSPRASDRLARCSDASVRSALAGNTSACADSLRLLEAEDSSSAVLVALGRNPSVPSGCLRRLAERERPDVRASVAENVCAPEDLLGVLSADGIMQVRMAASGNPNLPGDAVVRLSRDEYWTVRRKIGGHQNADRRTLLRLAQSDPSYWVRLAAAWNPNLSGHEVFTNANDPLQRPIIASITQDPDLLDQLARIGVDESVQQNVASNRYASDDTLCFLAATSTFDGVQMSVALNPKAPLAVIKLLLQRHDCSSHVRSVAIRNHNLTAEFMLHLATNTEDKNMMEALAADEKSGVECLSVLFMRVYEHYHESDCSHLLKCLAMNPNTPAKVLVSLSMSKSPSARMNAARHPRLPVSQLAKMTCGDILLQESIAQNFWLQRVADDISFSLVI